jgi:hypothetical protein
MVTGMDSLLAQGRRGELAREIDSGRLDRKRRAGQQRGRGHRWAFPFGRGIGPPAAVPVAPKIRRLRDAGVPGQP